MSALLDQANLPPSSLKSLILGGAMGQYVNINDLVTTGFIPAESAGITRAAGNTSLAGAVILTNNQKRPGFCIVPAFPFQSAGTGRKSGLRAKISREDDIPICLLK